MALDLLKPAAEGVSSATGLKRAVVDALRQIRDPEMPLNIYDLGLIYELDVDDAAGVVRIRMTLTTPACPVAQSFPGTVECALRGVPGVKEVKVDLVWDPPWSQENMSQAAKLELGLL